jgi:hypothetical protein
LNLTVATEMKYEKHELISHLSILGASAKEQGVCLAVNGLDFLESGLSGPVAEAPGQQSCFSESGPDALQSAAVLWMARVVTANALVLQHESIVSQGCCTAWFHLLHAAGHDLRLLLLRHQRH